MRQLRCAGMSLIELMLSLLLGSILLLSVINLLSHAVKDYQQQQQQIRQLENRRILDFIFSRSIHMAGFFGCRSYLHTQLHNHLHDAKLYKPSALQASQVTQGNAVSAFISQFIPKNAKLKPNSDVFIVSNLDTNTTVLQQDMESAAAPLKLQDKLSLKKNDIVIIDDCQNMDAFAISSISGSKNIILHHTRSSLNTSDKLSKAYLRGAQLGKFTWQLFYLRKTKDKPLIYGLFRQDQSGRSEELLDNVQNMRVYVALDDQLSDYIPVVQVQNWQRVAKVKINITLQNGKQNTFFIGLRN